MGSSVLPIEIWERVIDFIPGLDEWEAYSKEARDCLWSISLVCRAWVARCRVHLFEIVEPFNGSQAKALMDVIRSSPVVGQWIRVLKISPPKELVDKAEPGDKPETTAKIPKHPPSYHNWIYELLTVLPPFLTKLRELQLSNLPTLHPSFIHLASRFSTTVNSLTLINLQNQSFAEIIRLVNRFPHLQRLELSECEWKRPVNYYKGKSHKFQTLEVRTSDAHGKDLDNWGLATNSFGGIRMMKWSSIGSPVDNGLKGVLRRCTDTLRIATLSFDSTPSDEEFGQYLHIHKSS